MASSYYSQAQVPEYDYTNERLVNLYEHYKEYYQVSVFDSEEMAFDNNYGLSKEQIDSVKLLMTNFKISKKISFGTSATLIVTRNESLFDSYKNYGSVSFRIDSLIDTKGNQIAYPYTILNYQYIDDFNIIINEEEMAHFDVKATSNTIIAKAKGAITFTYDDGYDSKLIPLTTSTKEFVFDGVKHKIVDLRENQVSFLIEKDKDKHELTVLKDKTTRLSVYSTFTASTFSPLLYDYIFNLPFTLSNEQVIAGFNKKSDIEKKQLLVNEEYYAAIKTLFFKGNATSLLIQKKRRKKVITVPFEKLASD